MTAEMDRQEFVHVAMVKRRDEWHAEFVIDGRDYDTQEAIKSDLDEAYDFLHASRIAAEFEIRRPSDTEPDPRLPSWSEYKRASARPAG